MSGSYLNNSDFKRVTKLRESGVGRGMIKHPVTASFHVPSESARQHSHYVDIRFSDVAMRELGWQPHTFVDLYEGTGKSAGKLVIAPSLEKKQSTGYTLSLASMGVPKWEKAGKPPTGCAIKIAISSLEYHSVQSDDTIKSTACGYEVLGNELLVTMPTWFRPKDAMDDFEPVPAPKRRGRPPSRAQASDIAMSKKSKRT